MGYRRERRDLELLMVPMDNASIRQWRSFEGMGILAKGCID